MSSDIYYKLGERLNKNKPSFPLIEPVLKFLKSIYTEEQAALAAEIPMGAHTSRALAEIFNRNQKELTDFLEIMADKGLIFVSKNDDGEKEYSVVPFVPGLVEFQSMRGTETPDDIEQAHIVREMMEATEKRASEFYKNPEQANKLPTGLRTIPVEQELPANTSIRSYEQVSAIIELETAIAVGYCHCRHTSKLTGNPCKIENAPERSCFYFGKVADYMIDRGFAERVNKDECLTILKKCEDVGLVHNINDIFGFNHVLCNCCGCCCDFLLKMKRYRGLINVAPSNFKATVDIENCNACEECVSRCQVEAISIEDDHASVNHDYCLGCGNCVAGCTSDSLTMIRNSDTPPIKIDIKLAGLGR